MSSGEGLQDSLLQNENNALYAADGSVDLKGKPVLKSKTGGWKASAFLLATETGERIGYFGIASNLVTYLTSILHQGNASAASTVTTWQGTCFLTPLIGAFLADAYWGRYWTLAVFSTIYFLGLCVVTISASVPSLRPAECVNSVCPSATPLQSAIFFMGLYLTALGTGGIKPCVAAFGGDQFDDTDPKEREQKGSFFNWFYFSIAIGSLLSTSIIVWIQENIGWGVGFGIPSLYMGIAIACFIAASPLYRCQRPGGSPLTRMCQVVVASLNKRKLEVPQDSSCLYETSDEQSTIGGSRKLQHTDGLKCLDKAAVLSDTELKTGGFSDPWKVCTITQVEELKILIRLFPIWASTIAYSATYAQMTTFFVEQGMVMDRTVGSFTIPAATLVIVFVISSMFWVLFYDKIIVPFARKFTGKERGISELQRIAIGLVFSILSMASAALVEVRRLQIAKEMGLVDHKSVVPLKFYWQIPQFFFMGAADVFAYVGKLEFFYNQSPDAMRSLCTSFALLITAVGNYFSSFVVVVVVAITTSGGNAGWIPNNLNKGHLDYFFWLWTGIGSFNLIIFSICAMKHTSKKYTQEAIQSQTL